MPDDATQENVLARIRRITGQLEGVGRMVEEDRASADVLLQLASAQAALGEISKLVLRSHVETSVTEALAAAKPGERKQKIEALMEVFGRYGGLGRRSQG